MENITIAILFHQLYLKLLFIVRLKIIIFSEVMGVVGDTVLDQELGPDWPMIFHV